MWHWLLIATVVCGHLFALIAEGRLNRSNMAFLLHSGAEEVAHGYSDRFHLWGHFIIPLSVTEYVLHGFSSNPGNQLIGAFILILALLLRVWSIQTLGRMWSRKCFYIYGVPLVRKGPYRFLKHPEYMSRLLDIAGLTLLFSAWWSGTVCFLAALFYLTKIVPLEQRQLDMMAFQNLKPPHSS